MLFLAAFHSSIMLPINNMQPNFARFRNTRQREGYLYVSVMLTALAVSTMGLVALSAASLRARIVSDANDYATSQVLAQSAIEYAVSQLAGFNDWRTRFVHDVENPAVIVGSGQFTWKLIDDDGALADDDSDSVRLVGIGRIGRAASAESVRLIPTGAALSCLGASLHCEGDISVNSSTQLMTNQQISSGANISATGFMSSIQGNVESAGSSSGTISGTIVQNAAMRRTPGSSVFDYYLDNGTWINVSSLPEFLGVSVIDKQLICPTSNPFGERNPEGIYVIDCAGRRVCIKNSRIVGTIVLLNPDSNSSVEGSLRWDAAVANYPALLVNGELVVKTGTNNLDEITSRVNFNPSSAPYLGNTDSDLTDTYPSEINGIVYVSGKLNAPQDFVESPFRGTVICQSIVAASSARFSYRPLLFENPPWGFASGNPMATSPGSRRRETLPTTDPDD
jgi:hypothetical protein